MSLAVEELRAYARAKRRYGCPSDPPGVSSDELEALCDLFDAAPRNLACERLPEKVALPPDVEVCGHCEKCRFNAVLARLDQEDTG